MMQKVWIEANKRDPTWVYVYPASVSRREKAKCNRYEKCDSRRSPIDNHPKNQFLANASSGMLGDWTILPWQDNRGACVELKY